MSIGAACFDGLSTNGSQLNVPFALSLSKGALPNRKPGFPKLRCLFVLALMAISSPSAMAMEDHSQHRGMMHTAKEEQPTTAMPEPTDEERAAAFPDLGGMDLRQMMDTPIMVYALLDQFEWVDTEAGSALAFEAQGWLGNDAHRLWLRSEGERADGETEHAELQMLYGQPMNRWWDWVAGVRHDFAPSDAQSWLAAGLQGLAPYWFETEATLFLGEGGQSGLRLEVEYELLLSQQLVLQPLLELNIHGQDDAERGIGSGLSSAETGLRLRYEIRREIAPYIGLRWERAYGETAHLARQHGEFTEDTALVAGIRLWY